MNILYASHSFIPSRAANSIHVMQMGQAFTTNGHTVDLIYSNNKHYIEPGITSIHDFYGIKQRFNLVPLWWPNTAGPTHVFGVLMILYMAWRRLCGHRYDLVYGRFLVGSYLACLCGYKVIFEFHTPKQGTKLNDRIFQKLIHHKNTLRCVVISDSLRDEFKDDPLVYHKTIVAHDGANESDHTQKLTLSTDSFHVGYVGHLYRGRGVEMMLAIAKRAPWLTLHIVGGTEKDIEFWKAEAATIPNVIFYGFLSPGNTEQFRNSMDVLLAPYEKKVAVFGGGLETSKWMSPLKIFEYMSAGKAIISSNHPVLQEVLTHERNALLCEPNDETDWFNALKRLYDDPTLRHRLAAEALKDFQTHYSWQQRAKRVIANIPSLTT